MRPLLKAAAFTAIGLAVVMAAGPIVGTLAALTGLSSVPAPAYAAVVCALLLAVTRVALHREGLGLGSLGLVPSRDRIQELATGAVQPPAVHRDDAGRVRRSGSELSTPERTA